MIQFPLLLGKLLQLLTSNIKQLGVKRIIDQHIREMKETNVFNCSWNN